MINCINYNHFQSIMILEQLIQLFYKNKLTSNILKYNTSKTEWMAFCNWIRENFDEINLHTMLPNQIQVLRIMYVGLCRCCKHLIEIDDILDTSNACWSSTPNYWGDWDLYDEVNNRRILNYDVSGVIGTCDTCKEENKIKERNKELKKNMKKSRCKQHDYCCPICMDNIEFETHQIRLKCKHAFHPTCISDWTNRKLNCPCCRSDIIKPIK